MLSTMTKSTPFYDKLTLNISDKHVKLLGN